MNWKFLKDPCVLPIDCKDEDLEEFLDRAMEGSKGLKTLFIMDDLTSGHIIKKQSSLLFYLAMSGRHHNISTIVLVQQYTSCAKAVREQLEWVITFMPSDEEDIDVFSKKYLRRLTEEKREEVLNLLSSKKYAHILVQLRHPHKKFIAWMGQKPIEIKNE